MTSFYCNVLVLRNSRGNAAYAAVTVIVQSSEFSRKLNPALARSIYAVLSPNPRLKNILRFPPTGSEGHVGKLLPSGGVLSEVAVRLELHPLVPGVVQAVVDGRGDADLVADRDGEPRRGLCEAGEGRRAIAHQVNRRW